MKFEDYVEGEYLYTQDILDNSFIIYKIKIIHDYTNIMQFSIPFQTEEFYAFNYTDNRIGEVPLLDILYGLE